MQDLFPFIYRGVLTQESLDKAGRKNRRTLDGNEANLINEKLSLNLLEESSISAAKRMSLVYTAIHAFENMVREFVKKHPLGSS
jgi:hypothetical protein